jgi:hypothetical protein
MKNYTKIICILDRSGSMSSIIDDAIGGINTFITGQKEVEGNASLTVHLFDDQYETYYKDIDIKDAMLFDKKSYVPRGMTSLYDAIGKTINYEIDWLGQTPIEDRPEKTLCIILTDGQENNSTEFNREKIKTMIDEMRKDYKWEFIFLAANQDAALSAQGMGISGGNSYTFDYSGQGVNTAYASMSKATTRYRSMSLSADESLNLMKDIEEEEDEKEK